MTRAKAARVLQSFMDAVENGTTLAWSVAHAADGGDPIALAWRTCRDTVILSEIAMRIAPRIEARLLPSVEWRAKFRRRKGCYPYSFRLRSLAAQERRARKLAGDVTLARMLIRTRLAP